MNKTKKRASWQTVAVIVLALLLALAITLTATGAWFQDADKATNDITMGDPVHIAIYENETLGYTKFEFDYAMPGDKLTDAITFEVPTNNAPMFVRAKLSIALTSLSGSGTVTEQITAEKTRLSELKTAGTCLKEYPTAADEAAAALLIDADISTLTAAEGSVARELSADWVQSKTPATDKWMYYETVVTTQTSLAAAYSVVVPTAWTNFFNNAGITLSIEVEAVQAANIASNAAWEQISDTITDTYTDAGNRDNS